MLVGELTCANIAADPFAPGEIGSWILLRTRSRQEKVVAHDLEARGILHYLPLINCVRFYGHRKSFVEMPLFPGYVFLRGEAQDAYETDRGGRLAQIMPISDQDRIHEELRNIQFALGQNASLSPYPYLRKGVRAEVRSGPLRGLQGIIESLGRRDRLILQVDILGRAVSTEVDASLLDVID